MAASIHWHIIFSLRALISSLFTIHKKPFLVTSIDLLLSFYFFWVCGLGPCTVDLDPETTVSFWAPRHRRLGKPVLVAIHGYGGNSRWQFAAQAAGLARSFNLFVPDLLFFGGSYTKSSERTDTFQAKCIVESLRKLGVDRFSIYSISYGGYVGYRMAEIYPNEVDKVVIVSSGVGCTEEQKTQQLQRVGRNAMELLLPENPRDMRALVDLSIYKYNHFKWAPNFFFGQFVDVMCNQHRKEKAELVEHLLSPKAHSYFHVLSQEILLIWGDQDRVFPLSFGEQLQKQIGPNAKLEIIKEMGHAANIDASEYHRDEKRWTREPEAQTREIDKRE